MAIYDVEWCYYLEADENGTDPDSARYKAERFTDLKKAIARARKLLPRDKWGSVRVCEIAAERDPYISEDLGRDYYEETTVRVLYVDDEKYKYSEADWERYGC